MNRLNFEFERRKTAEQPAEADRAGFCPPKGDSDPENGR